MQAPKAQVPAGPGPGDFTAQDRCDLDAGQPLGFQLKVYFDNLTAGPVPDRLLKLTEQLEAAFERGELRCCAVKPRAG